MFDDSYPAPPILTEQEEKRMIALMKTLSKQAKIYCDRIFAEILSKSIKPETPHS
jgi:hypothetical protein